MPKILLVYANPAITVTPVPPYGAERVAQCFRLSGCDVRLVAPWLEPQPLAAFKKALAWEPDLVGFSIRNVDDALIVRTAEGKGPIDTTFYLPQIRPLVQAAQAKQIPILAGGAALSSMPEGLLDYLGIRFGILGAAEDLIWRLGRAMVQGQPFPAALPEDPRILDRQRPFAGRQHGDAAAWRPPPGPTPRMSEYLKLCRSRDARVPVQLAAGCDRRCNFCVEASFHGGQVRPRPVEEILAELQALRKAGIRRFWLTASELNVPDARHAIAVLRAIVAAGLRVDLAGFVQPAPVNDDFLDALEQAGVDPSGLSWELGHLDDRLLRKGAGPANLSQIRRLIELFCKRGYKTLGGSLLLGAHPEESWESIHRAVETAKELDRALPEGLGLAWAAGGRVYATAPLGRWVAANFDAARPFLYGKLSPGFIKPLVFCRPVAPRALLSHLQTAFSGMRGHVQLLNAEAPVAPALLRAERLLDRAILRRETEPRAALRLLTQVLQQAPEHPEALKQAGLLCANVIGDLPAAKGYFERLFVRTGDSEVQRVVAELDGMIAN